MTRQTDRMSKRFTASRLQDFLVVGMLVILAVVLVGLITLVVLALVGVVTF